MPGSQIPQDDDNLLTDEICRLANSADAAATARLQPRCAEELDWRLCATVFASDEDDVLKVMDTWFTAFNTGDADLMTSLYWKSEKTSSFGPGNLETLLAQGWDEIAAGWKFTFAAGTFVGTKHHPQVTLLGKNVAVFTDYNSAMFANPATQEPMFFHVRATYVLQKIDGKWLMVHEHASMLPTAESLAG